MQFVFLGPYQLNKFPEDSINAEKLSLLIPLNEHVFFHILVFFYRQKQGKKQKWFPTKSTWSNLKKPSKQNIFFYSWKFTWIQNFNREGLCKYDAERSSKFMMTKYYVKSGKLIIRLLLKKVWTLTIISLDRNQTGTKSNDLGR